VRRRRLIRIAILLVLLGGALTLVWKGLDWPPPGLLLKYGLL
jgi:hypothetical protein